MEEETVFAPLNTSAVDVEKLLRPYLDRGYYLAGTEITTVKNVETIGYLLRKLDSKKKG